MRNSAIDLAKLIAALLVVGIHTRPCMDVSIDADFLFSGIVCHLAVPFFAVCSGYYLTASCKFACGGGEIGKW